MQVNYVICDPITLENKAYYYYYYYYYVINVIISHAIL